MKNPGKIYVKDNLVFQSDIGYGVHVIDNSNPSQAGPISFIRVHGNTEMSIRGNYMYANSFDALVVIDVSDWQNAREVKRIAHAFRQGMERQNFYFIPPPEHGVYYECAGIFSSDRIQTGWVRDSIYYYNCYYP